MSFESSLKAAKESSAGHLKLVEKLLVARIRSTRPSVLVC